MCGRFTLAKERPFTIERVLGQPLEPFFGARYNITPDQRIHFVHQVESVYRMDNGKWGLIPSWSETEKLAYSTINARSETVAKLRAYSNAFKARRCLIPADGFYEWMRLPDGSKQPFYIRMRDGQDFAFAGLWETWHAGKADSYHTCTILTTEANKIMKPIHDRMPVILEPDCYIRWLDTKLHDQAYITPMLKPYQASEMKAVPVSTKVNSPDNDSPELIQHVEEY